jgi:methylmalonyl-CoA carboxyltransferase large subunit
MSLTMEQRIEAMRKKRAELLLGGGADKLEKHRAAGKLTAR